MQALEGKRGKDYKTLLQEYVQRDEINILSIICSVKVVPIMLKPSIWRLKLMVLLTRPWLW